MLPFGTLLFSHVPTYDSSLCITPPRHHTTSQVVYATVGPSSTAGIEIHCSSTSCPFEDNELIDYDFTMRDSYSLDTFSVYVGCLGCAKDDPITIPPLQFELEGPVLEPFAQVRALRTCETRMLHTWCPLACRTGSLPFHEGTEQEV